MAHLEQPRSRRVPTPGVSLVDLSDTQQSLGMAMMRAALSAEGLDTTERIGRINLPAGQAVRNSKVYSDELYYLTVMGSRSTTELWASSSTATTWSSTTLCWATRS
jgi:hypothetical protein